MKGFIITFPIIMLLMIQPLAAQQTATLTVVIDHIQTFEGNILVALYNNKEGYKHAKAFRTEKIKVTGGRVYTTFRVPANNDYAVALFQDLNQNDTLDTKGSMKIPAEPFGFSNNKVGSFGPPDFAKASFNVAADTSLVIHLITNKKGFFKQRD